MNVSRHDLVQGRSQGGVSGVTRPPSKKNYIYVRKLKKIKVKYMYYVCWRQIWNLQWLSGQCLVLVCLRSRVQNSSFPYFFPTFFLLFLFLKPLPFCIWGREASCLLRPSIFCHSTAQTQLTPPPTGPPATYTASPTHRPPPAANGFAVCAAQQGPHGLTSLSKFVSSQISICRFYFNCRLNLNL